MERARFAIGLRPLVRLGALTVLSVVFASCADHADGSGTAERSGADRGSSSAVQLHSALHRRHAAATPAIPCTGCHEELDGRYIRAKSWRCKQCHADAPLAVHAAAPVDSEARECWSCHDFTERAANAPRRARPAMPRRRARCRRSDRTNPKQPDEDCGACHRAHEQPTLVSTKCETCHHEPVSGHDKPPIPIHGCASCHGFHEPAEVASDAVHELPQAVAGAGTADARRSRRGRATSSASPATGSIAS